MKIIKTFLIICMLSLLFCACSASDTGTDTTAAELQTETTEEPVITAEPATTETIPAETEAPSQSSVMVPILMFHDVKTYAGGTWSMSADNFRKTLEFIVDNGYTPVSFEQLVDYVDGRSDLPPKPVCITLDDGYFSNYRNVLPIITERNIPITVFMTCQTVREDGTTPTADEGDLDILSLAELKIMEASPLVSIQSHTYDMHGTDTSSDGTKRIGAFPLETESESEFKEAFANDCALAENVLANAGVETCFAFSYPNGQAHEWAESVLRERNYRVSVTTDSTHLNLVVRGDPESLFLLGRMNVNDDTTEDDLFLYLITSAE